MEWLIKGKKLIQRLTFYVCVGSMFMLIPMMLLTTLDVVARRIWGQPIQGVVELSSYMLVVVILLGVAYTHQIKGHPRVTLISSQLSPRIQSSLEIITIILGLFMIFLLIWQGWVLTGKMGGIVSDVLRIPQFPFRLLVFVGAFFFFLELLIDLSTAVEKLLSKG